MSEPIRLAMWSGPRNISTAMMRSFGNRPDTAVTDEPFYAAFLKATGIDHPMREESMASQPTDPGVVVERLLGPAPGSKPIWYQKHITHHMVKGFPRGWIAKMRNAFLIRGPEDVLASYVQKREDVTLDDIGFVSQAELFERERDRLGRAPPVIEADDVLADPRAALSALCAALDVPFSQTMLAWPPGRRESDGVWAAVWYGAVERSTGFARERRSTRPVALEPRLQRIADAARPFYARLRRHKLNIAGAPSA